MMRRFAWCGMNRSMSPGVRPAAPMTSRDTSSIARTAILKVSLPRILIVWSFPDGLLGRRMRGAAAGDHDVVGHRAVGVDARREDPPRRIPRPDQHRPRPVREDHAGRPVLPVD